MKRTYQKLLLSSSNYVSFGFIHYFFSSLGQTFFISVFVIHFLQASSISSDTFSWVYASATIAGAFMLPFLGNVLDRVKLRYFSIANGLVLSAFCLLLSYSSNGIMLFVALLGMRLAGQGLMPLIGSTAIARYFEKERGAALSLSSIGLSISETIMPAIAVLLITAFGWDVAWRILSGSVLFIFIPAVLLTVKKDDQFQLQKADSDAFAVEKNSSRWEVLKDRRFYLVIPAVIFVPFFITGLFIHHNLLAGIKGWTMEWLATCFLGYGIFKTATTFVAGGLVDRYSAKRIFPFHMVPVILAVCLLLAGSSKYIGLAYLCLMGISTSMMSITTTAMWTEIYGYKHLGSIKSMVTTMVVLSSALGPVVIGYILGNNTFWFYGLLLMVFVMIIISLVANAALSQGSKLRFAHKIIKSFL